MARDQKTILRHRLVKFLSRDSLESIYAGWNVGARAHTLTRDALELHAVKRWDEDQEIWFEIEKVIQVAK